MLNLLLTGFFLALIAPVLASFFKDRTGIVLTLFPAAVFGYFCSLGGDVLYSGAMARTTEWIPLLGINLSFYLDGLSLVFALLISGVGILVFFYAGAYLKGHNDVGRFYSFLLMFMSSMLGVVLSSNVMVLFIFWELTSLSSFFLVGFYHTKKTARQSALQALVVTGVGGLALLVSFLLLTAQWGSTNFLTYLSEPLAIHSAPIYFWITGLFFLGTFTKSAQFPFHFWLPNAMEAPAPVSAYLHSATMVKAGIYLLLRFNPVLSGSAAWHMTLLIAGGITMLLGAVRSCLETDLKRILAYSTLSVLGLLTMQIGIGTDIAIQTAVVFLFAHALSKGSLFLTAGAIDHATGTRDITKLSGLGNLMPFLAAGGILAAFSKIGFPPTIGFIGKELVYTAAMTSVHFPFLLVTVSALSKIFLITAVFSVGLHPFTGKLSGSLKEKFHRPSLALWMSPLVLAALGVSFGLFPHLVEDLLAGAVLPAAGVPAEKHLAVWHGFNATVVLSILTLASGFALYRFRDRLRKKMETVRQMLITCDPEGIYRRKLKILYALAKWQTKIIQNGYLRYYLAVIFVTAAGLIGFFLLKFAQFHFLVDWSQIRFYEIGLVLVIFLGTMGVVCSSSLLTGIMALAVVGYTIALVYVIYGAPDLALTQFFIETLTVVLFLSILTRLPEIRRLNRPLTRVRDSAIAIFVGLTVTGLMLTMNVAKASRHVTAFFAKNSFTEAHGHNVVNTILVDFRALDTLGEITVLAVAGMGVFALLKTHKQKE